MSPNIQEPKLRLRDQILPELLEDGRNLARDFLASQKKSSPDIIANEAKNEPEAIVKPDNLEHAIGWAPTRANMRVIEAARESVADSEGHVAAHHKNKLKIAEGLRLAKEKRDNKTPVPEEETNIAAPIIDENPQVIDSFPGPQKPDINLSDAENIEAAPPVEDGVMTGAGRDLAAPDSSNNSEVITPPVNVAVPAESIQADNGQIPSIIETAKSDGRTVEVDPIKEPEATPEILAAAEIKKGDKPVKEEVLAVDAAEQTSSPVVESPTEVKSSIQVTEDASAKVAIPNMSETPRGSNFLSFFKKLIPRGDAGADQFNLAESVAEKRSQLSKPEHHKHTNATKPEHHKPAHHAHIAKPVENNSVETAKKVA